MIAFLIAGLVDAATHEQCDSAVLGVQHVTIVHPQGCSLNGVAR